MGKRTLHVALWLCLSAMAQVLSGCVPQASNTQSLHPTYTYVDYSANIPVVAQPGQHITLVWLAYPTGQTSAQVAMTLSVLLFRAGQLNAGEECLAASVSQVTATLDTI